MQVEDTLFVGGEWVAPAGSEVIDVVSPHTEEVVGRVPDGTAADIDAAVAAARSSFDGGEWSNAAPAERLAVLSRFAELYDAVKTGELARTVIAFDLD